MTKSELRRHYKAKRARLSMGEIDEKSMAIANKSLELPIWEESIYHLFLTIENQKEVNTEFIMHILNGRDKNITVSKSDFKTREMHHYLLTDDTKLKANFIGIPEPQNGIEIRSGQIDAAFIPLLAFDHKGNRAGYGQGFYDRFLGQCRDDITKIGLSFFKAEPHAFETNAHDIPLDYCVTPEKNYTF